MQTWLLLNGDYVPPQTCPQADDLIIAVDGGIRHADTLNLTPDLWIGDFDSSSVTLQQRYAQLPRQTHPVHKDDTDFGLALQHLRQQQPKLKQLHLIGAFGSELDHVFANLWQLPTYQYPTIAWGKPQHAIYLPARTRLYLHGEAKQSVSVFALSKLRGISYSGLTYPLHNADLKPFSAYASRNSLNGGQATIFWQHGDGLAILDHRIKPLFNLSSG